MNQSRTRDLAYIVVFSAMIIALGLVPPLPVGGFGVPIVLQNFGIVLAALILGPRRGAYAVGLFLILSMTGLPILPGGRSGLSALGGLTIGFLIGYFFAALVIGLIASPGHGRIVWLNILAGVVGTIGVDYALGVLVIMWRGHVSLWPAITSTAPFIPGDVFKIVVAAFVAAAVHRSFPDVWPTTSRRRSVPASPITHPEKTKETKDPTSAEDTGSQENTAWTENAESSENSSPASTSHDNSSSDSSTHA